MTDSGDSRESSPSERPHREQLGAEASARPDELPEPGAPTDAEGVDLKDDPADSGRHLQDLEQHRAALEQHRAELAAFRLRLESGVTRSTGVRGEPSKRLVTATAVLGALLGLCVASALVLQRVADPLLAKPVASPLHDLPGFFMFVSRDDIRMDVRGVEQISAGEEVEPKYRIAFEPSSDYEWRPALFDWMLVSRDLPLHDPTVSEFHSSMAPSPKLLKTVIGRGGFQPLVKMRQARVQLDMSLLKDGAETYYVLHGTSQAPARLQPRFFPGDRLIDETIPILEFKTTPSVTRATTVGDRRTMYFPELHKAGLQPSPADVRALAASVDAPRARQLGPASGSAALTIRFDPIDQPAFLYPKPANRGPDGVVWQGEGHLGAIASFVLSSDSRDLTRRLALVGLVSGLLASAAVGVFQQIAYLVSILAEKRRRS